MLAYETHVGETSAQHWMIVLHGIWGRRANWRTFARRWVDRMPGHGAVLVDLRLHGESLAVPGPHSVAAAAADVVEVCAAIAAEHAAEHAEVRSIMGHSFGGKVAILAADRLVESHALDRLWVIDAPPGPRLDPRDRTTEVVFERLAGLPARFGERRDFVSSLTEGGIAVSIAQWLATNLVEADGGWRFALDLEAIRTMLDDFMRVDAWPALERVAQAGTNVRLVLGGASQAVFGEQRERADRLAAESVIEVVEIPGAGHWVHVDRPAELLDELSRP